MSRVSTFLVLALTATLAASPAAIAGWSAKGNYEPDTAADVADHYMITTPDRDPSTAVRQVYFSGFEEGGPTAGGLAGGGISPNVGDPAVRTWFTSANNVHAALLGVWKDCNGDNVIGFGEQGLWEYRADLLVGPFNTGICPAENLPGIIPPNWMPVHNDGTWVHEFLPIQWRTSQPTDFNPYNINDNGARVWYDAALPGDDLSGDDGGDCWLNPQPRGTYHDAGGILRFTDCNDGWLVTDTSDRLLHDGRTPGLSLFGQEILPSLTTGVNADDLGAGQITYYDAPRDQQTSHSILNVKPWGEETDGSYVQAWDCGQGTTSVDVPATAPATTKPTHVTNVSQPNTGATPSPSGSIAGTANATGSGTDQCHRRTDANGGGKGGALANTPYATEGDVIQTSNVKTTPTSVLLPREGTRPFGASAFVDKGKMPPDFGVHTGLNDFWDDNTNELGGLALPLGASNVTYYAYISPDAVTTYHLTLPTAPQGKYGAEACGTHTSGIYLGWDCDATHWWKDSEDKDVSPKTTYFSNTPVDIGPKVGAPYNLRDIDCKDAAAKPLRDAHATPEELRRLVYNTGAPIVRELLPNIAAHQDANVCITSP